MAFLCSTPEPEQIPVTSTTTNQIPEYENKARQSLYTTADAIANEPYQPYGQPRIAGFSPDQTAAFDATRANVGSAMPGLAQAYQSAIGGTQTWPGADHDAYMNPYIQNVVDIQKREAMRDADIARNKIGDRAVAAGSFGGSRHGVVEAELGRNLAQQLGDIQATGLNTGWNQALSAFNADANRQLTGAKTFGDLGIATQGAGLKDAAALEAIGTTQQGQTQRNLDLAYQDFLEQRDYPKTQTNWLANIIKGTTLPMGRTETTQQLVPQQSPLAGIAGAGMSALALYNLFKGMARGGRVKR